MCLSSLSLREKKEKILECGGLGGGQGREVVTKAGMRRKEVTEVRLS